MKEIRISPAAQIVLLALLGAGVIGAILLQLPEIRRYLKIETM